METVVDVDTVVFVLVVVLVVEVLVSVDDEVSRSLLGVIAKIRSEQAILDRHSQITLEHQNRLEELKVKPQLALHIASNSHPHLAEVSHPHLRQGLVSTSSPGFSVHIFVRI